MSRSGNAWQACGERMPYICFALNTKMPDMRRFDGEKGTGRWRGAACEGPAPVAIARAFPICVKL